MAVVLVVLLLFRRSRGALLRALSLAALLLALANPTLRQEERESLANIAIVVIDESTSQTIAGRPEQTAAIRRELETRLAASTICRCAGSPPPSPPARRPPARTCSPISTARLPTPRPTGWPASS